MSASLARMAMPAQIRATSVWRAQPGALMLLGRASGPMPKSGSARLASTIGLLGVFRAEFWPAADDAEHCFLAVVRIPDKADPTDHCELVFRGARNGDRDLRLRLTTASGESDFGHHVAAAAGKHAAKVARFMLDVMRPEIGSDMARPHAVLSSFLTQASRLDGCVELILHVPGQCVVLQGWGACPPEPIEIITTAPGLQRFAAQFGEFARGDVMPPATGNILVLPAEAIASVSGLDRVFILAGNDLSCRNIVEQRALDAPSSLGQIRHLLPRLACPAPLQSLLRAVLRPRYEGHDTLNVSARPVRAALDLAVGGGAAGAYLSGWLFDPGGQVAELAFCGEGFAVPFDHAMVRIARADVSAAFKADPAFPAPSHHDAGFAVSVEADLRGVTSPHLRITFSDGDVAFLPVLLVPHDSAPFAGAPSAGASSRQALIRNVDLHKPSGLAIIERHLAPFVLRLSPASRSPGRLVLRGPLDRARAAVVPLRSATPPRSAIANFLIEPAEPDEQIVFVCGPEWDAARTEALIGLIRFYDLPASVTTLPEAPDAASAILEAASITEAATFLLLSIGAIGSVRGWRGALHEAAASGAAACPTVLFEDGAIRFAGSAELRFTDRAPFVERDAPLVGLTSGYVNTDAPTAISNGALSCCTVNRSAIAALQASAGFLTEFGHEAAFFLSLRRGGLAARWMPAVRVTAPEDSDPASAPVASLVDGWMLRQAWEETKCAS